MKFQLNIVLISICVYGYTMIEICSGDMELKKNVLKFGYGINYKYEGTLSHSFDRFYVVTKFELLRVEDFKLTTISYEPNCTYLDDVKNRKDFHNHLLKILKCIVLK